MPEHGEGRARGLREKIDDPLFSYGEVFGMGVASAEVSQPQTRGVTGCLGFPEGARYLFLLLVHEVRNHTDGKVRELPHTLCYVGVGGDDVVSEGQARPDVCNKRKPLVDIFSKQLVVQI